MTDLSTKAILTINETVTLSTLSRSTINRAFSSGKLKKTKLADRRVGIKRADLAAYLQNLNA